MSEFIVYSEKKAFDDITFNGDFPNLRRIFTNYATIILNLSQLELQNNIEAEGEIFYFLHANAGAKVPIAYPVQFENVYEDNSNVVSTPRSVYFLNVSKKDADVMKTSYGILVQSCDAIDDSVLSGPFFKELKKGQVIEQGAKTGWMQLLDIEIPPSNAIVISDSFLFSDTETIGQNTFSVGKENLVKLLDKLLPGELQIEYHVTVLSEDYDRPQEWKAKIAGDLNTAIKNLRRYDINVEIIFIKSEQFHKRRLIMNYVNASCDKGFSVFRVRDAKTVKSVNDIRFNRVFSNLDNLGGDSDFDSATEGLMVIKEVSDDLAAHIRSGVDVYRGAILGGCKADQTSKNRLINDV